MLSTRPLTISGVRTVVHVGGVDDARETVVFVHGNPGPLDDWEPIARAVASDLRVVTMDLPAFGRADRPWRFDYSVTGYATFLGEVLDAVGVERVHLVAHDFGGAWAAAWAATHADQVASVTLIATPVLPTYRWHTWARIWQTPVVGEIFQKLAARPLIAMVMQRDNPRPLPQWFVDRVTANADLHQKLRVARLYRSARDARATLSGPAEALRRLDVPACIIWGAADPYIDVTYAAQTAALFRDAEMHIVDGAGHWPFVDDPETVTRIVRTFLTRQRG